MRETHHQFIAGGHQRYAGRQRQIARVM
jgi:hypothetical protein